MALTNSPITDKIIVLFVCKTSDILTPKHWIHSNQNRGANRSNAEQQVKVKASRKEECNAKSRTPTNPLAIANTHTQTGWCLGRCIYLPVDRCFFFTGPTDNELRLRGWFTRMKWNGKSRNRIVKTAANLYVKLRSGRRQSRHRHKTFHFVIQISNPNETTTFCVLRSVALCQNSLHSGP